MSNSNISLSEAHWHYAPANDLARDVSITIADNAPMLPYTLRDPVLLIPGYGERSATVSRALTALGRAGYPAVAMVAPFEEVPATSLAIEAVCRETPAAVTEHLQIIGHVKGNVMNAITNSQGSAVLGQAISERPSLFGDVIFIEPMSSNSRVMCESYPDESKRLRQYLMRYLQTLATQNVLDPQQPLAGLEIVQRAIPDLFSGHLVAGMKLATRIDLLPTIIDHADRNNRVALLVGTKDSLFPASEVKRSLASSQTEHEPARSVPVILEDSNRHVALRTKAGNARLLEAVKWLIG